jgi:nitrogen PTS system EIIA component
VIRPGIRKGWNPGPLGFLKEETETMQLTTRDVGELLRASEATVLRWIKQQRLPAQRVAGQIWFNRVEVLEWALENRIKMEAAAPHKSVRASRIDEDFMQLSLRDLTKLLNVTESRVALWIKQRGLPAQQVGGQYRINRAELLEWATANQVRVSLELYDDLEADAEAVPSLAEALENGGIHYGLQDTNKDRALRAFVAILPVPDSTDRELLLRLFLAREASASTAIGNGIAIPHVRNPIVLHVSRPTVTLAFLERPVDFGALDKQPVHVLFSIISPTTRSHLQLLSRLSFALHDGTLRAAVVRQAPREEILREIRRVEACMNGPAGEEGKAAR